MKCTPTNIDQVCELVKQNLEDENGRGEFDNETLCDNLLIQYGQERSKEQIGIAVKEMINRYVQVKGLK